MGGMHHGGGGAYTMERPLGRDTGDVRYPLYLINGRMPRWPAVFQARPRERIRFRIINAGSDTAFRVALGGHRLTVTHADGFPVRPVSGDALLLGMGERYDVVVDLGDGVFPLVAVAEGKAGRAIALITTGAGHRPPADVRLDELSGWLVTVADLQAASTAGLAERRPSRTHKLILDGDMTSYRWTINGRSHHGAAPLRVREGERVRLVFENRSMMFILCTCMATPSRSPAMGGPGRGRTP